MLSSEVIFEIGYGLSREIIFSRRGRKHFLDLYRAIWIRFADDIFTVMYVRNERDKCQTENGAFRPSGGNVLNINSVALSQNKNELLCPRSRNGELLIRN